MNCSSVPWLAAFASAARLSRFGPIFPVVPAGVKTWQAPQPVLTKSCLPSAAFPTVGVGTLPTIASGVGVVTDFPPGTVEEQPASTATSAETSTVKRATRGNDTRV